MAWSISNIANKAVNWATSTAKKAYNYLKGSTGGNTGASTRPADAYLPTVKNVNTGLTTQNTAYLNEKARLEAENNNLLKQMMYWQQKAHTPQPTFNRTYEEFLSEAQKQVNPYYDKKWQEYMKDVQLRQKRAKEDYSTLEESAKTQERYAKEDYEKGIGDVEFGEKTYQTQEARTSTQARRALLENLAESGLTFSGIGKEQVKTQEDVRREEVAAAQRGFSRQEEDIATTKERALKSIETQRKAGKVDLNRTLSDIVLEARSKKSETAELRKIETRQTQRELWQQAYDAWRSQNYGY